MITTCADNLETLVIRVFTNVVKIIIYFIKMTILLEYIDRSLQFSMNH